MTPMRAPIRNGLLAAALLATYGFTHVAAPLPPDAHAQLARLPMALAPWSGIAAPPYPPEVVETLAADEYIRRYYYAAARAVEMDVAYYAQPRIGANMHSPLNCLPGNGWQIAGMHAVALPGLEGVRVRALTVERGDARIAMAYWFQGRSRITTGEASARFHLLADALRRRPTDTGLVRVMAPAADAAAGEAAVLAFASRLVPELERLFAATSG